MLSFCFPWYLDQSRYALEISLVHLTCCPFHLIGYQTVSYDNVALNDLEKSKGCNVYHNSKLTQLAKWPLYTNRFQLCFKLDN